LLAKRSDWLKETMALDAFSAEHQTKCKEPQVLQSLVSNNSTYHSSH
jgi:hypothetical protein